MAGISMENESTTKRVLTEVISEREKKDHRELNDCRAWRGI